MPKIRLTEQAVKKLKRPKPTDFFDRDYPRLVLRVSPGGTKTWRVLHYIRSPKTQKMIPRTVKLGRYPDLGVKEARDRARKFDPKEWAETETVPTPEKTYEEVVTEFIEEYAKPNQRSWKLTEGHLRSVPWKDKPFTSITKHDARAFLRPLVLEGHGAKARVTLAWLKKLWRWAATEPDYVETPVMDAVKVYTESNERNRVYSEDELKALWNAQFEPPRFCRRLVCLSHATIASSSICA